MKRAMKKLISILAIITIVMSGVILAGCEKNESKQASKSEEKTVPIYYASIEKKGEATLNFFDGINDIPYVSIDEIARILNNIYTAFNETSYKVTISKDGGAFGLIRENDATVYMTPETQRITFSQVNMFNMDPDHSSNMLDVVTIGGKDENANLIRHSKNSVRAAAPYMVELSDYQIEMKEENGTVYIPLQTMSDLLMSPMGVCVAYNGKIIVCTSGGLANELGPKDELGELFYDCERGMRSDELAQFCFNELCLGLDFNYGLKEKHHITDFKNFFAETGLIEKLMDNDPLVADKAIATLCNMYFGDMHSAFGSVSPLLEPTTSTIDPELFAYDMMVTIMNGLRVTEGRREFYGRPTDVPAYEEVGNTAYITFDMFKIDLEKDYYSADISEAANYTCTDADTIMLICYANQQIKRENSPM